MRQRTDIHNFPMKLKKTEELIKGLGVSPRSRVKTPITRRNAELILEYATARSLEGQSIPTRIMDMGKLLIVARHLRKDFDKATIGDIRGLIAELDSKYAPWTRVKLRLVFKRFYKWMRQGDEYLSNNEYPAEVNWITRGVKKKDLPRTERSDCWSEEDERKLLAVATHPRDKAIVALFTETGARVGEIGGLRIKDVYQDEFSYLIHLKGKTGERDDRVIYSGPYLADWLNAHPDRDNPDAPLFTKIGRPGVLKYGGIKGVLIRLAKKTGLQHKKCHPHIFRHSRATLLAEQGWPEPIIKEYLGWKKDSEMLGTYSHITSRQANRYMLKAHGIAAVEDTKPKLVAQLCATCHQHNGPDAIFCKRCGRPLTHKAILKYNHEINKGYELINKAILKPKVVKVLSEALAQIKEEEKQQNTT